MVADDRGRRGGRSRGSSVRSGPVSEAERLLAAYDHVDEAWRHVNVAVSDSVSVLASLSLAAAW